MNNLLSLWAGINDNAAALAILISIGPLFWAAIQYIRVKSRDNKKDIFKTYHKLIEELVEPNTPRLDRQLAVVYELRNFKAYYPVSIRILKGLKKDWYETCKQGARIRLIDEIDLAIEFMESKVKPRFFL